MMKSAFAVCFLAIFGVSNGFVSKSAFTATVGIQVKSSPSSSLMTMNAAERTYIMVSAVMQYTSRYIQKLHRFGGRI
jgi:hypothetical protein